MRLPRVLHVWRSIPGRDTQICGAHLRRASGTQRVLSCSRHGVTAGQLDLPSLTPLFVAGCGRLQLRVVHRATSVALLQIVDN